MTLKLYYVTCMIDKEETLFVMAETPEEAKAATVEWGCENWTYNDLDPEERGGMTPEDYVEVETVFEVTVPTTAGTIEWHGPNLKLVWEAEGKAND